MTKIRESIKQKKAPRVMETQKRRIHVNWEDEIGLCGYRKADAIKCWNFVPTYAMFVPINRSVPAVTVDI